MPLYIGDLLRDIPHLDAEKAGAYLLLIMAYWVSGRALPDDDEHLATVARVSLQRWRKALRRIIAPFFQIADGEWRHKRVNKELAKASRITNERSTSGAKGAAKRWQTHGNAIAEPVANSEANASQNDAPSQPQSQRKKDDASASSGARKGNGHDRSSRGSRLSPDWQPSAEDRDFAATLELDPDAAAAEFRDYWCAVPGSKGVKLDWSATYRNRCRELAKRGQRPALQRSGPATGIAQGFADALRMGRGEPDKDRSAYQPPPRALLGGQRG